MSLVPFSFNNTKLFTVTTNNNPWTRAKEVCKALEYQRQTAKVIKDHCSRENFTQKCQLIKWAAADPPLEWPKNSQPDEYYINE